MRKIIKYWRGIRLKILITILSFCIFIILIYSYFYIKNTNNLLKEEISGITEIVRNTLSQEAELALITGDTSLLHPILKGIVENPLIACVKIMNSQEERIFEMKKYEFKEDKNYFINSLPVFSGIEGEKQIIGKIIVYFEKSPFLKNRNKVILVSIIIGFFVLIFGTVFSLSLIGLFFNRLREIKRGLIDISRGEADLTKRIEIKEDEEFNEIANSFNKFLEGLSKQIFQTKASSMRVSEFSENISSAIEELTASSHEVTDTVQKVAGMATESAKNVLEATKSIKELLDIALTTNEEAKEMQEIESYSYNLTIEGRKIGERVSKELENVTRAMEKMRLSIDALGTLLKDILEISNTITIFMKRTNLLSLNASIEAARAGSHGKGFSIVAAEIRRLAEDSYTYAEKINQIVGKITDALGESTKTLIENQKIVEDAKDTILKAVEQLKKIADNSEESIEKIEKITKLTTMQKTEVEKLAKFMDKVGEITEQTSVSAEEIAASMEEQLASLEEISASVSELANISEELKLSLRGFKIE